MNYGSIVPSFYFYKFAEAVTQSYTSFAAYRAGNIDEKGNLLKPESSIDTFEYFVIKLKKIFEQLPYGVTKYQLQNYVSTLNLFAEEAEHFNITSEQFHGLMEGLISVECNTTTSYLELLEDMSAAGMAVAGSSPGYNQGGVSGMDPPMVPLQRRKPSISTDPYHMFDVSATDYEKIVGNKLSEIDYLRRFGARNPNSTLTVREPKSGKTYTLPKKKPLKEMFNLEFLDILNENSIVNDYNDANDKPGESSIATVPDKKEKVGQRNLHTIAGAQYKAMAHFIENHIKTLHNHDNEDDIGIRVGDTTSMVKLKNIKTHITNEILTAHNKKLKAKDKHPPVNISFQTKNGIIDTSIPHVSATGIPDLTINDAHISNSPITVDAKAARSRWENTGVTSISSGPSFSSIDDFNTGEPIKNSFIAIHDSEGTVTYTDHSHIPNIKQALSHVYEKSGSRRRPGRFRLIGEVNPRLSDFGQQQAKLNNVTVNQDFSLASGAQKNFARKWAELTGTKFGHNDVYTTSFKK